MGMLVTVGRLKRATPPCNTAHAARKVRKYEKSASADLTSISRRYRSSHTAPAAAELFQRRRKKVGGGSFIGQCVIRLLRVATSCGTCTEDGTCWCHKTVYVAILSISFSLPIFFCYGNFRVFLFLAHSNTFTFIFKHQVDLRGPDKAILIIFKYF